MQYNTLQFNRLQYNKYIPGGSVIAVVVHSVELRADLLQDEQQGLLTETTTAHTTMGGSIYKPDMSYVPEGRTERRRLRWCR